MLIIEPQRKLQNEDLHSRRDPVREVGLVMLKVLHLPPGINGLAPHFLVSIGSEHNIRLQEWNNL